ncbi:gliding motility-associated C-terminal domain-containing protein, partial [bacterium]|nr:gliding motility-associated C-terminal domain-containing protein [bacterium]
QSSGSFLALQPGSYTVEVRDATFTTLSRNITVDGNYSLPSLSVDFTRPTCSSNADGQVVLNGSNGNLIGTTAFPDYKYRIVDLSTTPQTIIQEQNTDTFTGLAEGTYTLQIEDGCQNRASEPITLVAPSITTLNGEIEFVEKSDCDEYEAIYASFGRGVYPHDITITDAMGDTVFSGTQTNNSDLSIGLTYNFGSAYTAAVVDACGQTENIDFTFTPDLEFRSNKTADCSGETIFAAVPSLESNSSQEKSILTPATLTLTNQTDPSDVVTYTISDPTNLAVIINSADITIDATYDAVLEDRCNYVTSRAYTFRNEPAAVFTARVRPERGCLDGTTSMNFAVRNSGVRSIEVTITSGPASFTSEGGVVTNYVYPRVFRNASSGINANAFPPGNYEAEMTDGCETGLVTWQILPSDTVEHDFTLDYVQSCGNSNTLIINPNVIKASGSSFYTNVNVINLDTGTTVFRESLVSFTEGVPVTVPNLPSGNYQLYLEFQDLGNCSASLNGPYTCPCEPQTVDINIPEYIPTSFEGIVGYTCVEGSGVIFAEGTNGVAPYQYEIVDSSVPSNIGRTSTDGIFTTTDEGTYTVRISDSCGNSADGAFEVLPYLPDLVATCDASGTVVTLMANPVPNATFTWIDETGTTVQEGSSNVLVFDPFDPSQGGDYVLEVTAPGLSCTVFDGAITVPSAPCSSSIDVSKTVESGPIYDGETDTYTVGYRITADNSGGQTGSYNVTDTFILGAGFTLNSATLAYGGESDGVDGAIQSPFVSGDRIITNESLAGLRTESWLVTAIFTLDRDAFDPTQDCSNGGGLGNTIMVTGDTDPSNDTACTSVEVGNVHITKDGVYTDTNTNGLSDIGDEVVYTFIVTNTGNAPLSNVIVTDPLLGGTVAGPASGDTNGDGRLDPSEAWTYTAQYAILQSDIDNGQVKNLATITGEEPNGNVLTETSIDPTQCATCTPDPSCPDCTLTELPNTFVDIALTKVVDLNRANLGDTVNFTITATNLGLVKATNISILEMLPNGFDYLVHNTSLGSYDVATALWRIAALDANEEAALTISALVIEGTDYLNIADLMDVDQQDTDPTNDEASAEVEILEPICEIIIYNSFSPNQDGVNEVFFIQCIENFPNNFLEIFNRWGVKVFEQRDYDNTWTGISFGRSTYKRDELLPVGTYYYVLNLGDGSRVRSGWVYISR